MMTTLDDLCGIWAAVAAAPSDPAALAAARSRIDALMEHVEACDRCAGLAVGRGDLAALYEALSGGEPPGLDAATIDAMLATRTDDEREVTTAIEEVLAPGLSAAARDLYRRLARESSPAQVFLGLDAVALLLARQPSGELAFTAKGDVVRAGAGAEDDAVVLVPREVVADEVARMADLDHLAAARLGELAFLAMRDNPRALLGVRAAPIDATRVGLELEERSADEDLGARWLRGYAERAAPAIEVVDLTQRGAPVIAHGDRATPPATDRAQERARVDWIPRDMAHAVPPYLQPPAAGAPASTIMMASGQTTEDVVAARSAGWRAGAAAAIVAVAAALVAVLVPKTPPAPPVASSEGPTWPPETDTGVLEPAPPAEDWRPPKTGTDGVEPVPAVAANDASNRWGGTDPGLACLAPGIATALGNTSRRQRPIALNPSLQHRGVRDGSALIAYVIDARGEGVSDAIGHCTVHASSGNAIVCDRAVFERIAALGDDLASIAAMAPDGMARSIGAHLDGWLRTAGEPGSLESRCAAWAAAGDAPGARTAALLATFVIAHQRAHITLGTTHRVPAPAESCGSEKDLRDAARSELAADALALSDIGATADAAAAAAIAGYLALDEAETWLRAYGAPSGRARQAYQAMTAPLRSSPEECGDPMLAALAGRYGAASGGDASGRCRCPDARVAARHRELAIATAHLAKAGFAIRPATDADVASDPALASLAQSFVATRAPHSFVIGVHACAPEPSACTGADVDAALVQGTVIGIDGLVVGSLSGAPRPTSAAASQLRRGLRLSRPVGKDASPARSKEAKDPLADVPNPLE